MSTKTEKQKQLLRTLQTHFANKTPVNSLILAQELSLDHDSVVGLLKSLTMLNKIELSQAVVTTFTLTEEGQDFADNGSIEMRLLRKLPLSVDHIKTDVAMQRALAQCLRNGWAKKSDSNIVDAVVDVSSVQDEVKQTLDRIAADDQSVPLKEKEAMAKRKLVVKSSRTIFEPRSTPSFSVEMEAQLVDLTKDLLMSGEWKDRNFKKYNFNAAGNPPLSGSIHPLMETFRQFKQVLMQMGFEEMDTRRWVENCFWNFDALFQPQTHPVRDAHDTFFLKNPRNAKYLCTEELPGGLTDPGLAKNISLCDISSNECVLTSDYLQRVKNMHEGGDDESRGWEFPWEDTETRKLILRTHTTAVTSRVLRFLVKEWQGEPSFLKALQKGVDANGRPFEYERKFFSIDRVFRNETLDATHLAEFHQVEGVVVSTKASLAYLMSIIKTFFEKIGIRHVRFKPAYNPYTEPSMEIFGYHPLLGAWTEIGNSGVFRPEMLRPMGIPDSLVVLGWGLSLERPTMINHCVKDIRDLLGPRAKLSVF